MLNYRSAKQIKQQQQQQRVPDRNRLNAMLALGIKLSRQGVQSEVRRHVFARIFVGLIKIANHRFIKTARNLATPIGLVGAHD